MRNPSLLLPVLVILAGPLARADAPPTVEHQPALCAVPDEPLSLCATISDDGNVAAARLYFRRAGQKYYSFVDMSFTGVDYCGTLPAPKHGKTKVIEYYVQAIDGFCNWLVAMGQQPTSASEDSLIASRTGRR